MVHWNFGMRASRRFFCSQAGPLLCESFQLDGPDPPICPKELAPHRSRLVFLGTGNSTGTPRPICLLSRRGEADCRVSALSMMGSPDRNRNYRTNPAALIQYGSSDGRTYNIQIDVGKTYREAAIRWYPRFGVPFVDGVIITHDHADAIMGLDELRTVQRMPSAVAPGRMAEHRDEIGALPVFVNSRHMPVIRSCFPYLMPRATSEVKRFIAKIDWIETVDFETFLCPGGLEVTSVPVKHGRDYTCQGFIFGTTDRVVYLSDVTEVPVETMTLLESEPIALLVVDCLLEESHPVHFGLQDALALVRRLRPRRALFLGMSDQFDHHPTNDRLRALLTSEGIDVQLAHDGLSIDLRL